MKPTHLIACLFTAALSLTSMNAQVLKNPSFEDAGDAPNKAANWFGWGDLFSRETAWTPVLNGTALMGYHHWEVKNGNNSGIWQDIADVKPGQRFKFSVNAWLDKIGPGSQVDKIELRLESTSGTEQIQIASASFTPKDIPSDDQWHKISVEGTAPSTSFRVLVVMTPSTDPSHAGAAKVDSASLEVLPDAATPTTAPAEQPAKPKRLFK